MDSPPPHRRRRQHSEDEGDAFSRLLQVHSRVKFELRQELADARKDADDLRRRLTESEEEHRRLEELYWRLRMELDAKQVELGHTERELRMLLS